MKQTLATMAAAACLLACDDSPQSHVYVAAPYVPSLGCYGPSASLGYVDTPDGNLDCAPTCLVRLASSGGADVYVSTMCGPFPAGYDATQTDSSCAAALAAWPAEQVALVNGINSCASTAEAGAVDAPQG